MTRVQSPKPRRWKERNNPTECPLTSTCIPCSHLHMCLCACMHVHTRRDVKLFLNASTRGGVSLSGYQNRVVNGGIYYNMIWGPGRQINKLEWNKLESPKTAPNIYKELIHDKKMRTKELGYLHTKMCVCFISFNQVFVRFSQVDMCTLLSFNINI